MSERYPGATISLLEGGNLSLAAKELGGTGRTHNWHSSRRIRDAVFQLPLYLADGLHAGNVAEAFELQAFMHAVQRGCGG